jgi:hypothetical protein
MKPQIHGLLFTTDFLNEGIRKTPGWNASENDFIIFRDEIKKIFATAQNNATLNEAAGLEYRYGVLSQQAFNGELDLSRVESIQ